MTTDSNVCSVKSTLPVSAGRQAVAAFDSRLLHTQKTGVQLRYAISQNQYSEVETVAGYCLARRIQVQQRKPSVRSKCPLWSATHLNKHSRVIILTMTVWNTD